MDYTARTETKSDSGPNWGAMLTDVSFLHTKLENDIGVNEVTIEYDKALTEAICDYFDACNQPTLFFVQLDDVDAAGHSFGSRSTEYFDAIATADERLGRIFDAVKRNGLLDDSLFMVTADHGHKIGGGHGRFSMRETNTTIAVRGRTVVSGGKMDSITRTRDVAAIALYALGLERPRVMTARVPANLFVDVRGETRALYKDPLDAATAALAWILT